MKMQVSTAIALRDELTDKLNGEPTLARADEIELSATASALLADTVARNELQSAIDETSGD